VVEMGKLTHPIDIGALSVAGIVVKTEHLSDLIREFGRLTFVRGRHSIFVPEDPCCRVYNKCRAKMREKPHSITLSRQNCLVTDG